jgi:hypothetical protein
VRVSSWFNTDVGSSYLENGLNDVLALYKTEGVRLMTMALCFSCGNVKWGAIVPCDECGIGSTGEMGLDILFSDHHMAVSTLEQFGQIVKRINREVIDEEVRFWTFLYYGSQVHSDLLKSEPPGEIAEQVKALYHRLEFPDVKVLPGRHGLRDLSGPAGDPPDNGPPKKKKRWKFW